MLKMFKRVGIIYGVVLVGALVLFLAALFPVAVAVVIVLAALYFLPRLKRKPLETISCDSDDDYLGAARSDPNGIQSGFFRSFRG